MWFIWYVTWNTLTWQNALTLSDLTSSVQCGGKICTKTCTGVNLNSHLLSCSPLSEQLSYCWVPKPSVPCPIFISHSSRTVNPFYFKFYQYFLKFFVLLLFFYLIHLFVIIIYQYIFFYYSFYCLPYQHVEFFHSYLLTLLYIHTFCCSTSNLMNFLIPVIICDIFSYFSQFSPCYQRFWFQLIFLVTSLVHYLVSLSLSLSPSIICILSLLQLSTSIVTSHAMYFIIYCQTFTFHSIISLSSSALSIHSGM